MEVYGIEYFDKGWVIIKNKTPIMTPNNKTLKVPSKALAKSIIKEIKKNLNKKITKRTLLSYAFFAVDIVEKETNIFINKIISFAETDTLCYRAEKKSELAEMQSKLWDPTLIWAEKEFGMKFLKNNTIVPFVQQKNTMEAIKKYLNKQDCHRLTCAFYISSFTNSFITMLAMIEKFKEAKELWQLSMLEENYNSEKWGKSKDADKIKLIKWEELSVVLDYKSLINVI